MNKKKPNLRRDKTSGAIEIIKKPKKHDYIIARPVIYEQKLYKKGQRVKLIGKLGKLFLRNGYIYA